MVQCAILAERITTNFCIFHFIILTCAQILLLMKNAIKHAYILRCAASRIIYIHTAHINMQRQCPRTQIVCVNDTNIFSSVPGIHPLRCYTKSNFLVEQMCVELCVGPSQCIFVSFNGNSWREVKSVRRKKSNNKIVTWNSGNVKC